MRVFPLLLALELLGAVTAAPKPMAQEDSATALGVNELLAPNGDVVVTMPVAGGDVTVYGSRKRGINTFLGIPYAKPPVGELRFAAPQAALYNSTVNATRPGLACMQPEKGYAQTVGMSEDCLTLNVIVPEKKDPLPVLVWIHGGGYFEGSGGEFTSAYISEYGQIINHPFVLVTLNYRLGIFGFGYGPEMMSRGAANNGLRDQRLALQWVKANIGAFGGDPDKVTVMGESAGGMSISLLMLDEKAELFHGAIMQSGAGSRISMHDPSPEQQEQNYGVIAAQAGCSGNSSNSGNNSDSGNSNDGGNSNTNSSGSSSSNSSNNGNSTFECLRAADARALLSASETQAQLHPWIMFGPKVDGDVVPDDPARMWYAGRMRYVPFIAGNVMDEGTLFVSPNITSEDEIVDRYLSRFSPSEQKEILQAYPEDPSLGSPFDTGSQTFGYSPVYKQASAIAGDLLFQADRRQLLQQANTHGWDRSWSYLFNMDSPTFPNYTGVAHSSDVPYTFGDLEKKDGYSDDAVDLRDEIMARWIYFAYYLDPNGRKGSKGPIFKYWPAYSGNRTLCVWQDKSNFTSDDYREEMQVFNLKNPPPPSSPDASKNSTSSSPGLQHGV